jgi:hypothetical protein
MARVKSKTTERLAWRGFVETAVTLERRRSDLQRGRVFPGSMPAKSAMRQAGNAL